MWRGVLVTVFGLQVKKLASHYIDEAIMAISLPIIVFVFIVFVVAPLAVLAYVLMKGRRK